MVRVAILGGAGYTAFELIQILLRHPHVEITCLTTRQDDQPHISDLHPSLRDRIDLRLENAAVDEVCERADCIFSCLPHAASAEIVSQYLDRDKRVVDFSADYRLANVEVYERWYKTTHPDPKRVGNVVYGLPELYRDEIKSSQLVANPGCFPTTAILGLAPLLKERLIETEGIIVDSKTGVSGAGRQMKPHLHFPECNESISAYGIGSHRHMPEIDQVLSRSFDASVNVIFTPHLVPMDRGILSTIYARPHRLSKTETLMKLFHETYDQEPFVRVVESAPSTKWTAGTNFCDINVQVVRGMILVTSAIDNLIKGASGAAVQNFNLMHGFEESLGLLP